MSSPLEAAQPSWRLISSHRSWLDASRMLPHSTQPGRVVALLQRAVELDRVAVHRGERRVRAQLADQPGRVERGPARQLVAIDEDDVALAEQGEVVGDRRAPHATPHHDDTGTGRERAGHRLGHAGHASGQVRRQRAERSRPILRTASSWGTELHQVAPRLGDQHRLLDLRHVAGVRQHQDPHVGERLGVRVDRVDQLVGPAVDQQRRAADRTRPASRASRRCGRGTSRAGRAATARRRRRCRAGCRGVVPPAPPRSSAPPAPTTGPRSRRRSSPGPACAASSAR